MGGNKSDYRAKWGPVLEDVICRLGQKCFHNTHYLCLTDSGQSIPPDACPFQAIAANLCLKSVVRWGECARVSGTYDLFVWFKFKNGRKVDLATRTGIPFKVNVPLNSLNIDCQDIVCEEGSVLPVQLCATNLRLEAVRAELEGDPYNQRCHDAVIRLKVVVEKEFLAFEHGLQPVFRTKCSSFIRHASISEKEPESTQCLALPEPTACIEPLPKSCLPSEKKAAPALPTGPAAVKGRVTDDRGNALFRTRIIASDGERAFTTRTNFNGSFLLPLYPDTYEITIKSRGYIAQTFSIALKSGEIKAVDLSLMPDPQYQGFWLKFLNSR